MFKPYDADAVSDTMPFPELAYVASTKSGDIAVPKLNGHQRSWILDIALRDVDLPSLKGKDATHFYDKVKTDAFDAKAFQHMTHPGDRDEEAALSDLVTAWHKRQSEKRTNKTVKSVAEDAQDDEGEDEANNASLLRGYRKAGWRLVSLLAHQDRFERAP